MSVIDKQLKNIIEKNPVALATINGKKPNVIAVAYVKIKNRKIIITDNFMKETNKNIKKNPNVSLAVWTKSWKGYKLGGEAKYYSSGKYLDFVKSLKENKGCPAKGAIVVSINKIKKLG
jgi:predicted pyridoxine 5'-phosphate oxidase superfamily flavin-nucleotide-binding protein